MTERATEKLIEGLSSRPRARAPAAPAGDPRAAVAGSGGAAGRGGAPALGQSRSVHGPQRRTAHGLGMRRNPADRNHRRDRGVLPESARSQQPVALRAASAARPVDCHQQLGLPGVRPGLGPGRRSRWARACTASGSSSSSACRWRCCCIWCCDVPGPLQPLPVALTAALGVAALAAFALQFFHPFDSTATDLMMHGAAVVIVLALAAASRRLLA